ncbi:Predicted oxidoreductase, contains short-chain dehydrogenase (SDR) and DUF2520 domains [Desulfatibacillum alkenivorans DSM 16219]|jgi:predicted short-subunit dehydrogenase-like oxidoreductase (DUF2520 family)|uniref:Predicted oxidoreductase, contains short-chain dehydrogenase (SDR) and DUF2520 domains n=1 Tax=Desulfatibacillum alkenivorans DSM 16219 TaxID=1121393 RepID=A0A1M6CNG6_9BACT|nr:Rossmann-like and DUF2520 domain-containing protein [Desulfatibacillum alkenivorans]SHI62530.1 Predicted oxidoreductase, contains short-chain dehydrogenase (SDR) and DUF2520 domains [Desulfatibacillum alkenivorans DSM 16219]
MTKPAFSIIGCGTVGTCLADLLHRLGYPAAGLASRTRASAEKTAAVVGAGQVFDKVEDAALAGDMVFITTTDDAIGPVCQDISSKKGFKNGAVVLHCSGALSSELLASARDCGAYAGSMHPLQSFAAAKPGVNLFEGILVSVEGDAPARDMARQAAEDLGAMCAQVDTNSKMLYHAAAVAASNYLVALLNLAFELNQGAGIEPKESLAGLMPLIQGTLKNIEVQGIPNALTGPIARGDVGIVRRHVEEIRAKTPQMLALYQTLGAQTVDIALAKGSIDEKRADELKAVLK